MSIDALFTLEEEQLNQLYTQAGFSEALSSHIEHDPDFQVLVATSEAIDELVVLNCLKYGRASSEFVKAKQQQKHIRQALIAYFSQSTTMQ